MSIDFKGMFWLISRHFYKFFFVCDLLIDLLCAKKVREKSRECHSHKPQSFPDSANSVDPDQTPQSAASDQGLHCLHTHPRYHRCDQFRYTSFITWKKCNLMGHTWVTEDARHQEEEEKDKTKQAQSKPLQNRGLL